VDCSSVNSNFNAQLPENPAVSTNSVHTARVTSFGRSLLDEQWSPLLSSPRVTLRQCKPKHCPATSCDTSPEKSRVHI
jgi:hypothetical protein